MYDRIFWSIILCLTIVMGIIVYPNHNKHLYCLLARLKELMKP